MSYHENFDRLGNPVYRRSHTPIGHRIVQTLGLIACIVLLALLYGGHK